MITGGVISTLFTVNVQVLVLLFASVALSVTIKLPTALTVDPTAGDTCAIVTVPAHPSVAVASVV